MRAGGVTTADVFLFFLLPSELLPLHRGKKGGGGGNMNAHHLRNEFIEVAVFFPISKCLVQRFK